VRVEGQLVLNGTVQVLNAAQAGFGLAYVPEELIKEPHPSIRWLAWRISRVMDSNVSRLSGREQLWIGEGWAAWFGMPPEPEDYGRSARHTREQVNSFRASAQQLLDYHDSNQISFSTA
jgi:hypothetical protein